MKVPTLNIDLLLEHAEAAVQNVYAVGGTLRDEAEASRNRGNREASSALDQVAEHVEDSSLRWNALALPFVGYNAKRWNGGRMGSRQKTVRPSFCSGQCPGNAETECPRIASFCRGPPVSVSGSCIS